MCGGGVKGGRRSEGEEGGMREWGMGGGNDVEKEGNTTAGKLHAAMVHIASISRRAKFSRRPFWLYYSNYIYIHLRVKFSRNGSSAKS